MGWYLHWIKATNAKLNTDKEGSLHQFMEQLYDCNVYKKHLKYYRILYSWFIQAMSKNPFSPQWPSSVSELSTGMGMFPTRSISFTLFPIGSIYCYSLFLVWTFFVPILASFINITSYNLTLHNEDRIKCRNALFLMCLCAKITKIIDKN